MDTIPPPKKETVPEWFQLFWNLCCLLISYAKDKKEYQDSVVSIVTS